MTLFDVAGSNETTSSTVAMYVTHRRRQAIYPYNNQEGTLPDHAGFAARTTRTRTGRYVAARPSKRDRSVPPLSHY